MSDVCVVGVDEGDTVVGPGIMGDVDTSDVVVGAGGVDKVVTGADV